MEQRNIKHLIVDIDSIQAHPKNVRQGDIGAISESLKAHGQYRPIVVDGRTNQILAGNHTWKAAKALGWSQISAGFVETKDDDEALRILLADNKANDLATYNDDDLINLLKDLAATDEGLEGSLFDGDDLDALIADQTHFELPTNDQEISLPLLEKTPAITKPQDIWILGNHRMMCGDCREPNDVNKLMNNQTINIAFTSPPYAEQRKYDETSQFKPIPPNEYVEWFANVAVNVKDHLANDGSWFVNIKPSANGIDTELYVFDLVLAHARNWGWHFVTEYCWERNGVPKNVVNRFRNGFEPIYQFTLDNFKMRPKNVRIPSDNVPMSLGAGSGNTSWSSNQGDKGVIPKNRIRKNGTTQTMSDMQGINVGVGESLSEGLAFPNNRLPTFAGSHEALGHTAAFPVGLAAWFIRAYTDENDSIYDPFSGSGSTIIAAEQEKRIAFGMEISSRYTDLICARYQKHTGIQPILEATGEAHNFNADTTLLH